MLSIDGFVSLAACKLMTVAHRRHVIQSSSQGAAAVLIEGANVIQVELTHVDDGKWHRRVCHIIKIPPKSSTLCPSIVLTSFVNEE